MRGKSAIDIFSERFVIGVGGAVPIFKHGQPSSFVVDPAVLVSQLEAALRRLAVEPFCSCPFLNHLPGQLKAKLESLDGGVSGEIGDGSAEGFAQPCNSNCEAIESCGHKRIP